MDSLVKFLKYLTWACILAVPFIVFIVDSSQLFPFVTGKNFAFRVLVEISLGSWILLSFFREEFRPKKSMLLFATAFFVGVMLVADLLGVEVRQSIWSNFERMDGWITLIHLLLYMLVLSSFLQSKNLWNIFWNTTIFASIGVGIYSLAQLFRRYLINSLGYAVDHGLVDMLPVINQGGDRVDATFGNAIYLAVYMMFHVFITLILLLRYKSLSLKIRALYISALVLQLISIYYTATRGVILGLLGGLVLSSILLIIFEKKGTTLKRIAVVALTAVVVMVAGFFVLKDSDFIRGQQTLGRLADISLTDGTSGTRFLMWDLAWEGVKEKPILGYGQGNFNYVFNEHYNPKLYDQEPWFDRAHNIILDWLVAGGFVGLLSYLAIFIILIQLLLRSQNFSRREKILYLGMIFAYFFQNLFVFDQIGSYMIFFAFLAYVHTVESKGVLFEGLFKIDTGLRDRVVVPVVLILMIATPFVVNADGYRQGRVVTRALNIEPARTVEELNQNIKEVKGLFKKSIEYDSFGTAEVRERLPDFALSIVQVPQIEDSLKQEIVVFTKDELERQVEDVPRDARYYLLLSEFLMKFGVFDEAIENLEKAIELSPKKQGLYIQLGRVYGLMDDFDKMLENMERGYRIYEGNDQAWQAYVFAAKVAGDDQLYEKIITEAWDRGEYRRVSDYLQGRLAIDVNQPDIRYLLAVNFAKWGMEDRAIENLVYIVRKYPGQLSRQAEDLIERIKSGEKI